MSTSFILPAFLSLALFAACKTNQEAATDTGSPMDNGNTGSQEKLTLGGTAAADSLFLFLERTPCFGPCKAYRINIYRSGYATYEGRANVEREGMHEARIGQDTLQAILKEAERIDFYGLKELYDSPVMDLPSLVIRMNTSAGNKQVRGRVDVPPKFRVFGETIEEMVLPLAWKPMRAAVPEE